MISFLLFVTIFTPPSIPFASVLISILFFSSSLVPAKVKLSYIIFILLLLLFVLFNYSSFSWATYTILRGVSMLKIPIAISYFSYRQFSSKDIQNLKNYLPFLVFLVGLSLGFIGIKYVQNITDFVYSIGSSSTFRRDLISNSRYIGIFAQPSTAGAFYVLALFAYLKLGYNRLFLFANLLYVMFLSSLANSKIAYYGLMLSIIVVILNSLSSHLALLTRKLKVKTFSIILLLLFSFSTLYAYSYLVIRDIPLTQGLFSFLFFFTSGRIGSGDSRSVDGWQILSTDNSFLFGINPQALPTLGDNGVYMLLWIGGLIFAFYYLFLTFYTFSYFMSSLGYRTLSFALWYSTMALLFFFFPFSMQSQLQVILPLIFYLYSPANRYPLNGAHS